MTQPGETPPAAGQTEMARHEHSNDANSGPVAGNRTPMAFGLAGIVLIILLMFGVVVFALAQLG